MKKFFTLFLSVAFLSTILTSCGSPDPVKFNDELVEYINKSHLQEQKIEVEIANASQTADFSNITENSKAIVDSINTYIQAVEKLETAKGGDALKANVIEYLKSVIVMVDSYKSLKDINSDSSEEEVNKLFDVITSKEKNAEDLFMKIEQEQKTFAKQHDMELR